VALPISISMSDLIERSKAHCFKSHMSTGKCLVCEQRDEIERLKKENKLLNDVYEAAKDAVEQNPPHVTLWLEDAVAALEESDD
jgi:hypothetical protein